MIKIYRLKRTIVIYFILLYSTGFSQYYFKGEVRDEQNNPLPNARIVLHSNNFVYQAGTAGSFGIISPVVADSATITLEGYNQVAVLLESSRYCVFKLKGLMVNPVVPRNKLLSLTRNLRQPDKHNYNEEGETYSNLVQNEFIPASRYPETSFAIHSNKASYSNTRRYINMNIRVPADAVRPEEMLNYFNLGFIQPPPDSIFAFHSYTSQCPWNINSRLLFLQLSAKRIEPWRIPPSNLVFLIDISGSMDMPNRLPLLKAGFKLLVDNLREQDTVSIVVYGAASGIRLPPTSGREREKIRKAIEELEAGGGTPGESGIRTAFRMAKRQFIKNGNNRVILATDGDFNIGQSSEEDLDHLITQYQQYGIYLTCLGVGMGNYKDSKLEILAKKGNGNFAYLDNEQEAEKVLMKELTQTLYAVADDAWINIRFNDRIAEHYRLIGYDNKLKAISDTLSMIEGGEVGSGQNLMILLEYFPNNLMQDARGVLAEVAVNYRLPSDSSRNTAYYSCSNDYMPFDQLPTYYRFSTAVALFSELLRSSKFVRGSSWADVLQIASGSYEPYDFVQKEFITLVQKARKMYGKRRRR